MICLAMLINNAVWVVLNLSQTEAFFVMKSVGTLQRLLVSLMMAIQMNGVT